MKLLFFIGAMKGGGAERVMATLCNKLAERGHDVYLATSTDVPIAYSLNKEIKICDRRINRSRNKIINAYRYLMQARKMIKEVNPDIVISFMWELNIIVILASRGLSIPLIVSEHTTFNKKKSLYERFVRLYVNRLADKVTILTKADYNYLGTRLPNKVIMPNPLSFSIFNENIKRKKNILAAGGIDRWHIKGFDTLIKVWGTIAAKYPDWSLNIAGKGSEENVNYLKKIATKNNVSDSIYFLGFSKNIAETMQQCSIFVISSRYEGLPMVLIEAMSQGCACISFDCPFGPREIIENGKSGILVKDQDIAEFRQALITLMEDENLRYQLSVEGKIEAKKFDTDTIINKWENLFIELKNRSNAFI